jgi:predicted ATPase/DNA-binding SARP family transcriptional activator/Tfp pilus assembly protein PilF
VTEHLHLTLFGSPQIAYQGQPLNGFVSTKVRALLIYLAVTARPHSREHLSELLWADTPASKKVNLRKALSNLRQLLGDLLVEDAKESITLAAPQVWVDVRQFKQQIQQGLHEEPIQLYLADFLSGFNLSLSYEFETWALAEQSRLKAQMVDLLRRLALQQEANGALSEAILTVRRLIEMEPWQEEMHRWLMELLARDGQRMAVLAHFAVCQRVLQEELGVEPSAETVALLQQLQKPAGTPPVATRESAHFTHRHNLPVQSTTFVGRETEQAQIIALLADPHCRLLTLVGPGGVGKTRLALQAVATQLDGYEHGIWFVALAPLLTADLVAATCLEALNLGQQPHMTPDEQLLHYLRQKHLLLLLDNFEHLPAAVGLVKAILKTAPQVKLLITTRERLKVQEEWVFTVGGLATPTVTSPIDEVQLATVAESSASQLFVERARRLQPTFALTAGNAAAIAQICRTVDGIPLAIELAAGWSRLLPPAAIAQAMAQDFTFLSSAWQDLPPRHQSLAAVFGHSWRLLTAAEQAALRQLVVFRGGFLADAAQAVAGASLALLAGLVDKSWLRVNESGRFDLHELIRQFIVHQNGEPIPEDLARHSRYYGAFLQSQEPFLDGPQQREVLDRLLAEVDNIRQGWHWAVDHIQVESIAQYLKSWQWLGEARSWFKEMAQLFGEAADRVKAHLTNLQQQGNAEGRNRAKLILARLLYAQACSSSLWDAKLGEILCEESLTYWPEESVGEQYETERLWVTSLRASLFYVQGRYLESNLLCRSLLQECLDKNYQAVLQVIYERLGYNAYTQGQFEEAQQWFEQSLATANTVGGDLQKLSPLTMLAEIFCNQGAYAHAEQCLREKGRIAQKFDDVYLDEPKIWGYLAFLTGRLEEAEQAFQRNLQIGEEINDKFLRFVSWRWFGNIAYRRQAYAKAHQCFSKALVIARAIHRQPDVAIALAGLGKVACAQGDLSSARANFQQALDLLQKAGALPDLLDGLVGMSQWWLQAGAPETAARLLGFVRQHPSLMPLGKQEAAQVYPQLQAILPEERLVAALEVGAAMTVDEAVALALTETA